MSDARMVEMVVTLERIEQDLQSVMNHVLEINLSLKIMVKEQQRLGELLHRVAGRD